jgi:CHAT domain-containing protein
MLRSACSVDRPHPDDPAWLQSGARADVLEVKYDAAVEALRRALELKPHQPDLLLDLGIAYFQRAQSEDRQEDYGAAFEYLSQVLVQQPDNAVALFNRAIVAEHQFLYRQALEDWDHYLRLDSASQWAEEGRNHADAIRAKLKEHEAGALLTPDQVANAPDGANNPELERRVEQYLDAAVRDWLPAAYPDAGPGDPNARKAIFFLAELTSNKHQDRWLSDLVKGSSAPSFPRAVAALARSSQNNNSGDFTTSATQASQAANLFRAAGNEAGTLRAQFELAYSQQNTRNTDECRKNASASLAQAERMPYAWLQIQLGLEKAVCFFLGQDDWGTDERISRGAMERASASQYNGLYVRALSFVADDQVKDGDLSGGLKSISIALARYWSKHMQSFRAYDLYYIIISQPEFIAKRPYLVLAAAEEGADVLDTDGDYLSRAWAHSLNARAAAGIHLSEEAEREYNSAAKWFALAPKTAANRSYLLSNEIDAAGADARAGRFTEGIRRLTRIQNQVPATGDRYIQQAFFATLGELNLRNHQPAQAEQAYAPALESAEQRLSSLNSEAERVSWSQEAADVYLGMAEAKLAKGQAQEALDYFEWYLAAADRTKQGNIGKAGVPPPRPDASLLANRLPLLSDRTVLAYAALPDGLAIWAFDNRGVHSAWGPQSNQNLQELAARLHELTADPKSNMTALRRDARSLFVKLVSPVEAYLEPGRTVVIQADGWLAQIPFEVLMDSGGHYWTERVNIVRSLGLNSDASAHTEIPIDSGMRALIVGSPAASQAEGLVPLPGVAAEVDAVSRNFRAPLVLKGQEATIAELEAGLPGAAVFHFTGHSLLRPNGAALLLSSGAKKTENALFGAEQFRQQDLSRLQLAVLSACNTASGRDSSRGFNSITEALQRAGVPHVVASRWAVDSVATHAFVDGFYRKVLSGQTVSEAVRQTSRSMMADLSTSHPYYWAAFSAYGRP